MEYLDDVVSAAVDMARVAVLRVKAVLRRVVVVVATAAKAGENAAVVDVDEYRRNVEASTERITLILGCWGSLCVQLAQMDLVRVWILSMFLLFLGVFVRQRCGRRYRCCRVRRE